MGSVSTMGAFLDHLAELLQGRSGLRGVAVFTAPVADVALLGAEHIVLAVEPIDDEYQYIVGTPEQRIEELYPVECYCISAGAIPPTRTEADAIKIVRDRTLAILEEVYDQLRESNTSTAVTEEALGVRDARITRLKMTQTINDEPFARICEIRFTIRVKATFTPAD
jgi:hypothetical protein